MLGKLGLSLLSHHLFSLGGWGGGSWPSSSLWGSLLDIHLSIFTDIDVVVHQIIIDLLVCCLIFLVDQRKPNIVLKLSDSEIQLNFVFQIGVFVDFFEERLGECSNDTFFIIINNILEKLIDELHLEIGQVESSVIVWVVLVCQVQNHFVSLALLPRVNELVDQPVA